jgi:hypothetical protein
MRGAKVNFCRDDGINPEIPLRSKKGFDYSIGARGTACGSPLSYTSVKYRAMKIEKNGAMMRTRNHPMNGIIDRIPAIIA